MKIDKPICSMTTLEIVDYLEKQGIDKMKDLKRILDGRIRTVEAKKSSYVTQAE